MLLDNQFIVSFKQVEQQLDKDLINLSKIFKNFKKKTHFQVIKIELLC